MLITLSEQERMNGVPDDETVELAVELIRKNGYVGLSGVLSQERIASLRNAFEPLFRAYVERKGYNTGTNRAQMYLPFAAPFIADDVAANGYAMPIIDRILGRDCRCTYLASDTACPGSDYQNVHSDVPPLFPDLGVGLPSYSLVLNIPLVDVNEENGPLEVWPGGTHLDPESTKYIDVEGEMPPAARRMHSEKVLMPAGTIVIRDIRMWHRGTPNRSGANRTNLALIYNSSWYGAGGQIHIPQSEYESVSVRVRELFRYERIGAPVKMPWEW